MNNFERAEKLTIGRRLSFKKGAVIEWWQPDGTSVSLDTEDFASLSASADRMVSVTKFGIYPDGVTDWAAVHGGSRLVRALLAGCESGKVLYWPPGFYAISGINLSAPTYNNLKCHFEEGAEFGCVWHLISSASPPLVAITAITRTTNVVSATVASTATLTNGMSARILNVSGGTSSFDAEDVTLTVVDATHFSYPNTGANESGTVNTGAVTEAALKGLRFTGTLCTYDRLGTINLRDTEIERVHLKSDTTKNKSTPGEKCRGAHIYFGTDDLRIGSLIVDDCGNLSNTDAAVAIDGSGMNPRNLHIGRIWVKKSDVHGVYLTGGGHYIGDLRVDEFGALAYGGAGAQDSDGLAQTAKQKGVWINRAWDTNIARILVGQSIETRAEAHHHILIDETGVTSIPLSASRPVVIGSIIAKNAKSKSIAFGDQEYIAAGSINVEVGYISVQMQSGATLDTELISVYPVTTNNHVSVRTIDILGLTGSQRGIRVYAGARFFHGHIEARDFVGQIMLCNGYASGGTIAGNGNGSYTGYAVDYNGAGASGSELKGLRLTSAGAISTSVLRVLTADNVHIKDVYSTLFRGQTANVLIQDSNGCSLHGYYALSTGNVGTALHMRNLVNFHVQNLYIPVGLFLVGIAKHSGTSLTRCSAVNCYVTGNGTNTDVPGSTLEVLNAASMQL